MSTQKSVKEFEAINVEIVREDDTYRVGAVSNCGATEFFEGGALNLNGYAFATSSMEIGEYNKTVRIEQEVGSRYINLYIDGE